MISPYVYYSNAGAAEMNDADTWNADYGVVYHLKEDPAGTAPQARDSTANAVHGTYDIAGATVEDNTLWGGKCILFDNGPRLRVDDNPAIEDADPHRLNTGKTFEIDCQHTVVATGELLTHVVGDTFGDFVAGEKRLPGHAVVSIRDDEMGAQNFSPPLLSVCGMPGPRRAHPAACRAADGWPR